MPALVTVPLRMILWLLFGGFAAFEPAPSEKEKKEGSSQDSDSAHPDGLPVLARVARCRVAREKRIVQRREGYSSSRVGASGVVATTVN